MASYLIPLNVGEEPHRVYGEGSTVVLSAEL